MYTLLQGGLLTTNKMNLTDLKIYGLNLSAFAISMTEVELFLKITVLVVTIGYTIQKWYLMNKEK